MASANWFSLLPQLALLLALALTLAPPMVRAFDQRELQLFDLVEEVNANFYELLGTTRSATGPEIRRAFRKASMVYHPDRLNKHDPETVDFFRRMNAIHEVLKDETLRQRYDEILDHGLPDWRNPVYYYRKWRKLSLLEAMLVFAIVFTIGHYLVLWGVYVEQKLAIDDLFRRKSRKKQKQMEEELKEMEPLVGPGWRDLLPLVVARSLWAGVTGTPDAIRAARAAIVDRREAERERLRAAAAESEALAEEARRREQRKQQKRERRDQQLVQLQQQLLAEQHQHQQPKSGVPAAADSAEAPQQEQQELVEGPWSDTELQLLVRAVTRYPRGTPGRWEKIAGLLRRSVPDVTAKAREAATPGAVGGALQQAAVPAFEVGSSAAVCGESDEDGEAGENGEDGSSSDGEGGGGRTRRRRQRNRRKQQPPQQQRRGVDKAEEAGDADDDDADDGAAGRPQQPRPWSQAEQSQLEAALREFPKGTRERWDRVSAAIGTRGPEECAQRCKAIAERLRLKKE